MPRKNIKNRKTYSHTLDQDLMKEIKHLAVDEDRNVNDVLEEAIRDVVQKHKKKRKN